MIPEVNKPNGLGVKRIINAANCSVKGFKSAWSYESAFRQEVGLAVLMFPLSFLLAQSSLHWVALFCTLVLMLFAEMINSAIEALADSVTLDHHALIGRAKDMGSAAVSLSFIIVAVVWGHAALVAVHIL